MDRNELRGQLETNALVAGFIANTLHNFEEILKSKPKIDIRTITEIAKITEKAYMDCFEVIEQDFNRFEAEVQKSVDEGKIVETSLPVDEGETK